MPKILLDIDCTLNDMRFKIFEAVLDQFPVEGLTLGKALDNYYYAQDIRELHDRSEVGRYISELISDESWLSSLEPLPKAVECVNLLNERSLISGYLTTRPESQRALTLRWLKRHGFPELPLKMRPVDCLHKSGESWKADYLKSFPADFIVDDHPLLPAELERNGCSVKLISFGQKHSCDCKRVFPCPDWPSVISFLKSFEDFPRIE